MDLSGSSYNEQSNVFLDSRALEKWSHVTDDRRIAKSCECRKKGAVSVFNVQSEYGGKWEKMGFGSEN